jgi:hypothetical protein
MEFTHLLDPFVDYLTPRAGSDGAASSGSGGAGA